eukprot:CAMPEP_0119309692 /NCGR_PEP_ID=MMETSP1333-20130426/16026_1 /TAXON_ID=418940 /ORGANISM="Scyphosphaera apsteinii, Strain RCC1455" /LENGTH=57 /DNA_ID=CAMNT_0007313703 /DNA_START=635 /DNA_END=805 /DNA_ORIENTATION=+
MPMEGYQCYIKAQSAVEGAVNTGGLSLTRLPTPQQPPPPSPLPPRQPSNPPAIPQPP